MYTSKANLLGRKAMSKNLADLNVDEVTSWLTSISLDNAFAHTFKEQQIDGFMLSDCEEDDFELSDFPKARKIHWKKFWYDVGKKSATTTNDLRHSKIDTKLIFY